MTAREAARSQPMGDIKVDLASAKPSAVRSSRGPLRGVRPVVAVVAGLVVWEIISRIFATDFLPPFSDVIVRLGTMIGDGVILSNLAGSLINFVVGFAIALVLALVVGMAMGASPKIYSALDVYVNTLLTVPMLIFAPIFFTIFGPGTASIVGVIVLYAMFIMIIMTADAVRAVDRQLIEMARMFGAGRWELMYRIRFPAALPLMMAGFRLGAGRAVKGMINAEMFIAAVGLGAIVQSAGSQFDAEGVLAVLVVIVTVALIIDQIVTAIDRHFTSWLPLTERQ